MSCPQILRQCEEFCTAVLNRAANRVGDWSIQVHKMKSIYHTLNLCNIDVTHRLTIAEMWCPVLDLGHVQHALNKAAVSKDYSEIHITTKVTWWTCLVSYHVYVSLCMQEHAGSSVRPVLNRIPSPETPPTFNRTNRFTAGFQLLVDTYGVNTYQELNPGDTSRFQLWLINNPYRSIFYLLKLKW